ncbi:hypothetical protein ACFL2W_01100, partial [Candidatus Omnitrophota bacterium]
LNKSFEWTIPDEIGTTNKIQIIDNDPNYPAVTVTSEAFEIKGQLKLVEPYGGETYYVGDPDIDVQWKYAGTLSSNLDLFYDDNEGLDGYPTKINTLGAVAYDKDEDPSYICHYDWPILATAGTKYRLKIEYRGDTDVNVTSNQNFVIKGSVALSYPGKNPGSPEMWYVDGASNSIGWTVTGGLPEVDLLLNTNSGLDWNDPSYNYSIISQRGGSNSPYTWAIPDDGTREDVTSDKCRVRVRDHNDPTVLDSSTNDFYIKPKVYIGALPGLPWTVNDNPTISWTSTGDISTLRLYYSNDNGLSWSLEKDGISASAGSTSWLIDPAGYEKVTNNEGILKLVRYDGGSEDSDTTSPSPVFTVYGQLTLTSPLTFTNFFVQATGTIDWDVDGLVGPVAIQYNKNDTGGYPLADYITVPGADNIDSSLGTFEFNVPNDPDPTIKFRVAEMAKLDDVYSETPVACAIKGNIILDAPTCHSQNLVVGTAHTLTWTNVGNFTRIAAYYIKDGGSPQPIDNDLPGTAQSVQWIPGDDDLSDDIIFRVEDYNDPTVKGETPGGSENTVTGSLDLTYPNGFDVFVVGASGGGANQVRWVKQGNIGNLVIELSTTNGTSWLTAAQSGLHDDYPSGVSGATETYDWDIPDQISKECLVRVTSKGLAAKGLSEVTDISGDKFTIRGNFISLSSPGGGATWYADEADKDITWTANGAMRAVDIDLFDGVGWSPIVAGWDNNPTGLGDGQNTYVWPTVADKKNDACRIRVESTDNPAQEIESGEFTIRPNIQVTDIGVPLIAESTPTVTWTVSGTQTATVDILLDYASGSGGFGTTLDSGVAATAGSGGYATTNPLPATLSGTAQIRVIDSTIGYEYVKDETANFSIIGEVGFVQPDGSDWTVGETNRQISWTSKGAISTFY